VQWYVGDIENSNSGGCMELTIHSDEECYYPISVEFSSKVLQSGIEVFYSNVRLGEFKLTMVVVYPFLIPLNSLVKLSQ
jgi:hypothetical protein